MDHSAIKIIKLTDPLSVAEYAANILCSISDAAVTQNLVKHIALSGGSTPALLFRLLSSKKYIQRICWNRIHLWWGDERCVPPDSPESNFGNANRLLLKNIKIPLQNIHRIKGELSPQEAAGQYQQEIHQHLPKKQNMSVFDWVILGMGSDGHTASIFNPAALLDSDTLTAVTVHPESGQNRITLTPRVLQSSKRITFLVTGKEKSGMVRKIHHQSGNDPTYVAGEIISRTGITEWVLDAEAGSQHLPGK